LKYILIFLVFFSIAVTAADYQWKVNRVIDGDTISVKITELPLNVMPSMVRIAGIDAPEKGGLAHCQKEKDLGLQATTFTREYFTNAMLGNKPIVFNNIKRDKYASRVVGDVTVDGVDFGKLLIEKGLAKPYTGVGPKPDWCL
jgi:micrococcal nuclease